MVWSEENTPLLPVGAVYPWIQSAPLTIHELRTYANSPGWIRARYFALSLTVLIWCLLLSSSLTIAFKSAGCPKHVKCDLRDSKDLTGIRSKLDYIAELGIKAVWLSPIFKSPMKDFGYDISDFKAIDGTFGTMEDFKALHKDMKERDIRLILDLVPNHSSNEHDWFLKSIKREEPYTDYYVWAKPKVMVENNESVVQPPNNWISVFGGPAWTYNEERGEYYLHQFAPEQPDLNFRNTKVVDEMKDILRFWLNLGVSGFRVDAVPHLFEDELLRDEPRSNNSDASPDEYSYLEHIYTHGLEDGLQIMKVFRDVLDEFSHEEPKILLAEVYDSIEETMKYYGDPNDPIADFPFNFLLVSELSEKPTAENVQSLIKKWMDNLPLDACPNWVLGNHDQKRLSSRIGPELIDGLNMISLLLPGVSVTYYGEEIGMQDVELSWEQTVDPAGRNAGPKDYAKRSRDPQRSPMQWDNGEHAGFSSAKSTWLPVNENHKKGINVDDQMKATKSHLNTYRALIKARDYSAIKYGALDMQVLANGDVFAFTRIHDSQGFLVAVNFNDSKVTLNMKEAFGQISEYAEVYSSSATFADDIGNSVNTSSLVLNSKEAVVLLFNTP